MEKEDQIIGMLEAITERLDSMDKRFDGMDGRFGEVDKRFDGMDGRFGEVDKRFDGMDGRFGEVDKRFDGMDTRFGEVDKRMEGFEQKLEMQGETLKEHGQILRALRTGQEYLKAEVDGMKVSNAKEFGFLKEALDDHSVKLELVRDETWANKVDIHRIKTTMGMK
ncbi:hypothetical protein [Lentibacillus sp. Marseille-P4043]|uniref:hypothetical protein n=1 Tax=Lentibacillus sp. Marseille-P4043 TaxID=2040293 RepID=UPI000D0B1117|nr:hypothetical protein [Lentibacillus sp. Marseille-P4043]